MKSDESDDLCCAFSVVGFFHRPGYHLTQVTESEATSFQTLKGDLMDSHTTYQEIYIRCFCCLI